MKILECKRCGGKIDPNTLQCLYCGVFYSLDTKEVEIEGTNKCLKHNLIYFSLYCPKCLEEKEKEIEEKKRKIEREWLSSPEYFRFILEKERIERTDEKLEILFWIPFLLAFPLFFLSIFYNPYFFFISLPCFILMSISLGLKSDERTVIREYKKYRNIFIKREETM